MSKRQMKYLFAGFLLLIVFPTVYVMVLNEVVPHSSLNLSTRWSDYAFEDWSTDRSALATGNVTCDNGILSVTIDAKSRSGTIVTAQRQHDLPTNLSSQSFLKVLVKTSSINVSTRVVIWTNASYSKEVLVKTYNDNEWHTEFVNLSYFGVSENIYMVELSAMQIYASETDDYVSYSQLTFEEMEV